MPGVVYQSCTFEFSEEFSLRDIEWQIEEGQHWALIGGNGAGKSALAATLAGEGKLLSGTLSQRPARVDIVSFEAQRTLIDRERDRDDSDITDTVFSGTKVHDILLEQGADLVTVETLAEKFGISRLLDRGFRQLSTGETRKVLLIRALAHEPDLLVLDEPFDGLDVNSVAVLTEALTAASESVQLVFVLNRMDEIPGLVTHIAWMANGTIEQSVSAEHLDELKQLLHLQTTDIEIPEPDASDKIPALKPEDPLVRMRSARVAYGDEVIFENLNWQVNAGEHWQVTGPNGSGKTCLLNLITGDHPQCYINDIFVFGFQRGQGESIWEIKQHIGYVSTALQWEYRVSVNLLNVIISGFYDSIGLYNQATDKQKQVARDWLALMGMTKRADQPFNQLSYGEQRMILIARAMVKHPHLLILDEPCLGLDDINRALVLALIEKICAGSESTVIYVNHHQEDKIPGIERYLAMEDF